MEDKQKPELQTKGAPVESSPHSRADHSCLDTKNRKKSTGERVFGGRHRRETPRWPPPPRPRGRKGWDELNRRTFARDISGADDVPLAVPKLWGEGGSGVFWVSPSETHAVACDVTEHARVGRSGKSHSSDLTGCLSRKSAEPGGWCLASIGILGASASGDREFRTYPGRNGKQQTFGWASTPRMFFRRRRNMAGKPDSLKAKLRTW